MLMETPAAPRSRDWTAASAYSLGFLTLISAFNYLDRSILGLVLPLIKAEMQVSDTVLGLVSGLAFVLFYSLLGIPIAWAADRYSRRNIIATGLAFWSAMTAMTGMVGNIVQLAIARCLMGAGEAACIAPSQSMLADLFTAERRPLAISIFGTAFGISSLLMIPMVGWVSEAYGWRAAFAAAGAPGLIVALLFVLTVKEPVRGGREARPRPLAAISFPDSLRALVRIPTYLYVLAGVTMMGANVYAGSAWSATFLQRVHGMTIGEIANMIGPVRGILGVLGVLMGGWLADRLGRRDPRWRMMVPGLLCLAVVPAEAMFLLSDTPAIWISGLALTSLFTFAHQGPIFAVALSVVRVRMRATAVAVLVFCSAMLGQVFGPLLVGWLNDALLPSQGPTGIRYSLTIMIACALLGGIFFMLGARAYEADARRAGEDIQDTGKETP